MAVSVRLVVALLAAAGLAPATAGAATVEGASTRVEINAAPGEANRIRITGSERSIEITDAGASLSLARSGCTTPAPGVVRCPVHGTVSVSAGDGSDTVTVAARDGLYSRLEGGPGDDDLGAPDRVDYGSRTAPLTVRLEEDGSARAAGEPGEGDRLVRVDGVVGGAGNDILSVSTAGTGAPFDNAHNLVGGPGDDVLIGRQGDDRIDATEGMDLVYAGLGNDLVDLGFGGPVRGRPGAYVHCGGDYDSVEGASPADRVAHCDGVSPQHCPLGFFRDAARAGGVAVETYDGRRPVRVGVRMDGGPNAGRLIAHGRITRSTGRLRLTALGRRLAQRRLRPQVRVACDHGRGGARTPAFRFAAAVRR